MKAERRILLVSGEASGDRAAATVVGALRRLRPDWRIDAVGGELTAAAGARILYPYSELNVMGFGEVATRLPGLVARLRALAARLRSGAYDLFLPVDFPGFNLRLAARARSAGLPVLYFVAPQVWAWGRKRVAKMRQVVDCLAVILPFEEEWFRREGIEARYVGHPIMEESPPLAADPPPVRLGLLPGSRAQEIRRHLPVMLAAAARLGDEIPHLECEILEANALPAEIYDPLLARAEISLHRRRESSLSFLGRQGAVMVASGTATLESAVVGVPMAVIYKTGRISYGMARRLVKLKRIALANIVAGRDAVPEFIQSKAEPGALAAKLAPLLLGGPEREAQQQAFADLRQKLGGAGCGEAVARMALELLEGG